MYRHCLSKLTQTALVLSLCSLGVRSSVQAQDTAVATPTAEATTTATPTTVETTVAPAPEAPKPKPKYSLPWALRPAIAPNVLRSDSSYMTSDPTKAFVSTILGGAKFLPNLGAYGKLAITHNNPEKGPSANAVSNPLFFLLYTPEVSKGMRLPVMLGFTLPVGGGGGDDPDLPHKAAQGAAIPTRSAMENALYAVNFFTVTEGIGYAWIKDRLTLQVEATLFELFRARGDKVEKDSFRLNSTFGAHAGYAILDMLTLSAEIRYQRWLTDAAPVKMAAVNRDTLTVGGGARLNLPVGKVTLRPGFAYFAPLDDPMKKNSAHIFTFDVPVLF
ncbi:MAG: hypothetical protein QM778_24310 [Myxococcales bacterium]